ncbi:LPS-assembly protein LptD [Rhizorhapis suberifaciens]|uniref:LPS-assembly protein LptD n=1 Tax=Rhizorhapis suberifaciens TaxID=13656 RepID=A0A840HXX4_9SPHN|nr:LPS assembly protein LptD [Rhizorhapis suberifaciens]MBB4642244.1 LPS-assembly protein [Rhizorhapis suberifaciens]
MPPKPIHPAMSGAVVLTALAGMAMAGPQAQAQDLSKPVKEPVVSADLPPTQTSEEIAFAADQLEYDDNTQIITASGNVQLSREGNRLRADRVVWNRSTGKVEAFGNISVTNPAGDVAYGDSIELTDTLKDGVVENLLLVLERGGRLAARRGVTENEVITLDHAAYSPCAVEDSKGCPKEPTWQIRAVQVVYDPHRRRVTYKGARVELFGLPLIPLPGLSHPAGGSGGPGLLVPDLRYDRTNGLELSLPYFVQLGPNRNLTVTPHIYSDVLPMVEANYQALLSKGAYQLTGYVTYGRRVSASSNLTPDPERDLRGYIDGSGKFQLDPYWSVSGSVRVTTDRTFLRRYDISRDDRLRSTIEAERIGKDSYFSLAGWAVQTLRADVDQGTVPIALPVIDYRRRFADPLLGGKLQLQLNSLAITRTQGQDTQRAFAGAQWDLRKITGLGQEVSFTTYLRGDIYHSDQNLLTETAFYRGDQGWEARGIAAAAVDVRWPFIGEAFGGAQKITPRVQIVAAPKLANLSVPNEDARGVELEDSNLFALNRFPGYDRFEDSTRITYGLEYSLNRPSLAIDAVVGQSYRLNNRMTLFPDGTGLSERVSDIVGRTTIRYKDFISLAHRYRLDKDSLAIRRNEIDATVGSRSTYVRVGYLRLNRNIGPEVEDLKDREEIRLGARVQLSRFWSVFGSTVVDLTDSREDPLSVADGYEPVRHRLGIAYEDDCLEMGVTWRRDYQEAGDARHGNTFLLRLAFRNLGI